MREIKFRAWDKDELRMVERPFVVSNEGEAFDEYRGGGYVKQYDLMQFTGLKDKNGKEIYEGDVVEGGVYYGWPTEKGFGIVEFGEWEQDGSGHEYGPETCLGWYIEIKESEFGYIEGSHLYESKANNIEVIGNIYENPELIKKE
jgi:uncharacterized phage protein (TIGR01671 family)